MAAKKPADRKPKATEVDETGEIRTVEIRGEKFEIPMVAFRDRKVYRLLKAADKGEADALADAAERMLGDDYDRFESIITDEDGWVPLDELTKLTIELLKAASPNS